MARRNPIKHAHIDYFICTNTLNDIIHATNIIPGYRFDQSVIELKLLINKFVQNGGRWHLNTSLLSNKDYIEKVNDTIDQMKINYAIPVYSPYSILDIDESEI